MTSLSGMTGFGRAGGEAEWGSWTWEAKSVNGRGLDVRVNVPGGFEGLDQAVKKYASSLFTRGNMQVGLRIEIANGAGVAVDEAALLAVIAAFEKANQGERAKNEALATLMTVKGVVETDGGSHAALRALGQDKALRAELQKNAEAALAELKGIGLQFDERRNSERSGGVNSDVIALSQRFAMLMGEYQQSMEDGKITVNEAKRLLKETTMLQQVLIDMKLNLEDESV